MLALIGDGIQFMAHEAAKLRVDCVVFCPHPPSEPYPEETRVVSDMLGIYRAIHDFAREDEDCLVVTNPKADLGGLDSEQIANKIDQLYQRKVLSMTVTSKLEKHWTRQACYNALARFSRPTIDEVSFPGVPAVLLLPGPSLADNIHKVKKLKGKAVIIAGQRAWKQCTEAELTPDCVVAVDAQELVFDHMCNQPLDRTSLILEQSIHPSVMNLVARNTLIFEGQGNLFPWFSDLFPETVHIAPGITISSTMMALACFWRCNPIITVGMDLAYRDGSRYGKEKSVGTFHNNTVGVNGQNGKTIRTSPDLAATKDWIEFLISQEPNTEFINCSTGGAFVHGMKHIPITETFAMCSEPVSPMSSFDKAKSRGKYSDLMNNVRLAIKENKIPEEYRELLVRTLRR